MASQPGRLSRWLLPYRDVARGDIVVFHHPQPPFLVKRVVGLPGDRLRIEDGRVVVNGVTQDEPYAAFEPAASNPFRDDFPAKVYTDPEVDPRGGVRCKASPVMANWWSRKESISSWETIAITARTRVSGGSCRGPRLWPGPLVIYFSLTRPSSTDVQQAPLQASDDRLGHDRQLSARVTGFARWKRIFHVVH